MSYLLHEQTDKRRSLGSERERLCVRRATELAYGPCSQSDQRTMMDEIDKICKSRTQDNEHGEP